MPWEPCTPQLSLHSSIIEDFCRASHIRTYIAIGKFLIHKILEDGSLLQLNFRGWPSKIIDKNGTKRFSRS